MRKSLKDISWDVSEETYREDPALSYSTLARYEREGFNNLSKLFDRVETPSLTFGSAVDSIITGGQEEFDDRFIVVDLPTDLSDTLITVAKTLFDRYNSLYTSIGEIPEDILSEVGKECDYYAGDKYRATRIKHIKEKCAEYYHMLYIANGKTILNTDTYNDVCNTVNALKSSASTSFYFAVDNPFDDIERCYQLKFKGTFNGIDYRNMADLIVVNHSEKWVLPIDLKTSGKPEWDFHKSFNEWRYDIQARLYWAIIRQNMDKDDYFKDFKLLDYKFIVANRKTLIPLVWECPFTQAIGTLTFGKNNQITYRTPFEIGEELHHYLSTGAVVPIDIKLEESNNIAFWLNKI
jgi:uncharacterized protein YegP (UPF0339 family)